MSLPVQPEASLLLMNCINHVMAPFLTNNTLIIVIDSESKFSLPVILYDMEREAKHFFLLKADIYVLDTRRRSLNSTLVFLEKRTYFNPRATFVIMAQKFVDDYLDVLKMFFLKRTIIIEQVSPGRIRVYAYELFKRRKGKLNINIRMSRGVCEEDNIENFRFRLIYDGKERLPVIKVGAGGNVPSIILTEGLTISGVDMEILNIISNNLNFETEVKMVEAFAGTKNANDFTFNGSLGYLERREVDLVIGGVLPTSEGSMSFDFTQATSANRYAWIVPSAEVRPFWKRLMFTFSLQVWSSFGGIFVLVLAILSSANRCIKKGRCLWDQELLKLYSMCLTSVSVRSSEIRSKKVLYTSWYMFLLIFVNYFTAKLLSNLMVTKFEHQIQTLAELMDGDWKICIFSDLTKDIGDYEYRAMMSCTNCATCTNRTAYEGDVVSIRSEKLTLYEMGKFYTNEDRVPLVFILNQYYLVTYDVMVFRKNHPLYGRFNTLLGYLIESGVYDRIEKKYSSPEVDRAKRSRPWTSLKRETLSFTFQFLGYGWAISFLVFVAEFALGKVFDRHFAFQGTEIFE